MRGCCSATFWVLARIVHTTASDSGTCSATDTACKASDPIPDVRILIPEAVSRTVRTKRPKGVPSKCCFESFQAIYDEDGNPILASAERFLCNPEHLIELAHTWNWQQENIHPNEHYPDDPQEAKLRGNGWPGARIILPENHWVGPLITDCLEPIVNVVWPAFKLSKAFNMQHLLGLISPEKQPGGTWLDAQRNPHTDIRWDVGTHTNGTVPASLATVLSLTHKFSDSGTSIWRTKRTMGDPNARLSFLETVQQNRDAQGAFSNRAGPRGVFPDLDVRQELPDPCPQCKLTSAWNEAITVAHLRYNRLIVYDGRRLHNQYLEPSSRSRLSLNASVGRLTMNSFYWHSATSQLEPKEPKRLPTKASTLSSSTIEVAEGIDIGVQRAVKRITTTQRPEKLADSCCWKSFETVYDKKDRPVFASIDGFLCDPEKFVRVAKMAASSSWNDMRGFPAKQMHVPSNSKGVTGQVIERCLEPVVTELWPDFDWDMLADREHSYQMISPDLQQGKWRDSQRLPHNEIRWDLGTTSNRVVPLSLVTTMGLSDRFNDTGLGIWRTKQTTRNARERLSLLETVTENEVAQGSFNANSASRVHPHLAVSSEIPDPHPHKKLSHAWAEAIAVARNRYNRLVITDGRRLQHDYIEPAAEPRLSSRVSQGRLTLNSFFWQKP